MARRARDKVHRWRMEAKASTRPSTTPTVATGQRNAVGTACAMPQKSRLTSAAINSPAASRLSTASKALRHCCTAQALCIAA